MHKKGLFSHCPWWQLTILVTLFTWAVWGLLATQPTQAKTDFVIRLRNHYPDMVGSEIDGCHLCHRDGVPDGPINAFADDFFSNQYDLEKIDNLDSDGDGFTNLEEFTALTLPGDPDDFPAETEASTSEASITPTPPTPTPSPSPTATATQTATPTPTPTPMPFPSRLSSDGILVLTLGFSVIGVVIGIGAYFTRGN